MKPILFSFGPFHLFAYGTMIALGVLLALFLMRRQAQRDGFPAAQAIYDYVFWVLLAGFLGARLLYILQNFDLYRQQPWKALAFWEGGLIFYGGMISSFAALWLFIRRRGENPGRVFDFLLPYVALVHAFGRLGCFLNGCCYGEFCDLPWAVQFPETPHPVHPTQLYEAAFDFFLFWFLLRQYRKPHPQGAVAALYFMLYPAGRFLIEFWRAENPFWLALTRNQWLCLAIFLAALLFWMRTNCAQKRA